MNTTTFDWNLAISAITLLAAILSPIITTCVNNRHLRQIKQMELNNEKRTKNYYESVDVIRSYLFVVSTFLHGDGNISEYEEYSHAIYLYIPSKKWGLIQKMDNAIRKYDKEQIFALYEVITKSLAEEIEQVRTEILL